jgi:hypothetical protein
VIFCEGEAAVEEVRALDLRQEEQAVDLVIA